VRVTFDRDRCSGHARCAALAPEVYPLDEEGYVVTDAKPVPRGWEQAADRGARACPEGAIIIQP
jgi:ferredoxin